MTDSKMNNNDGKDKKEPVSPVPSNAEAGTGESTGRERTDSITTEMMYDMGFITKASAR